MKKVDVKVAAVNPRPANPHPPTNPPLPQAHSQPQVHQRRSTAALAQPIQQKAQVRPSQQKATARKSVPRIQPQKSRSSRKNDPANQRSDSIIRLSVSSDLDFDSRRGKLFELGSGHRYFGYLVGSLDEPSDYLLSADELIEDDFCCIGGGCCIEVPPTLDDISFNLTSKKGLNIAHIFTHHHKRDSTTGLKPNIHIVFNTETKGIIQLDYPPSVKDHSVGDTTKSTIPTAVIDNEDRLIFVFREIRYGPPCQRIVDIITADGTGYVVAKMGDLEALTMAGLVPGNGLNQGKCGGCTKSGSNNRFCLHFLDESVGRSIKEMIFGVAVVFFYEWLIQKVFQKKQDKSKRKCCVVM